MIKKKTVWTSDFDGKIHEFSSKQKAIEAEIKYNQKKEFDKKMDVFLKYFPKYHGQIHNRYRGECVDCGTILYQFDTEYDGFDARVGKLLWEKPSERFFNGLRCPNCNKNAIKLFEKMLKFKYKKNPIDISFFGLEQFEEIPEKDSFVLRNILDVVDNWDNQKHRKPYGLNKKTKKEKKICQKTKSKN